MITKPDFSKLYAQLNLRPDCSLEDFKHAYRRQVGNLHPDRRKDARSPPGGEGMSLPDLMSLYAMAMQFQREHGRLPGAPIRGNGQGTVRSALKTPAPAHTDRASKEHDAIPRKNWLLLVALLAVIAYLVISEAPGKPAQSSTPSALQAGSYVAIKPPAQDRIAVGMDAAEVLSIQGTPSHTSDALWEYGPSWISFKKGRVVGWYSSPFYPLRSPKQQSRDKSSSDR